jgi:hypothetical protein
MTKPTLHIQGTKWFDSVNGNTYFSTVAVLNGETVLEVPAQYGYGDQYLHETIDQLEANGDIPTKHDYQPSTAFLRDNFEFTYGCEHVQDASELLGWDDE